MPADDPAPDNAERFPVSPDGTVLPFLHSQKELNHVLDLTAKEKLLEKKIPVIVDEKLQIATMNEIDWVQDFSMILCNTINFYVFLSNQFFLF